MMVISSLIGIISIGLPVVYAAVKNQHLMPPGTNYQNMTWSRIYCDGGSYVPRDRAQTVMNQHYLDNSWGRDWVWIDSKKGYGAHVATSRFDVRGTSEQHSIEWLFTFDLNAGPKFTYIEATAEDRTTYPHNGSVLNPFLVEARSESANKIRQYVRP